MADDKKFLPDSGKDPKKRLTFLKTFNLAAEFGLMIVIPLLGLGYLGKYLDSRYHHKSLFTLTGILLALAITSLWFYRTLKRLIKEMKDQ